MFDFDGVIVDSLHAAYSTWKEVGATITLDEYRAQFDGNVNHAFQPAPIDFHEYYQHKVGGLALFPGIDDVIIKLASAYILVIVSSTVTAFIDTVLKNNNLHTYFDAVLGNDISPSKVEKFNMVFKKYNVIAPDCIMVTDTLGDMKEAHVVSLRTIGVTWGFQKPETLRQMNPAALVDEPHQIVSEVNRLLA